LLPTHERLAELEKEAGPLTPWHPDNSVRYEQYDDRVGVLGDVTAGLLVDFYNSSNDLAFQVLDHVRSGGSRLGVAFDMMLATAHALSRNGLPTAGRSFRSHAEAFLNVTDAGRVLRPTWDRHYETTSGQLRDRVWTVVDAIDGGVDRPRFVTEWVELLRPIRDRAQTEAEDGNLRLTVGDDPAAPLGRFAASAPLTDLSPFHRDVEAAGPSWRELAGSPWFTAYRIALNFTYLQLTRLGVTPTERFMLCHLAANAVDDAYRTTHPVAERRPTRLEDEVTRR
jgi:hypothetical protein